MSPGSTAQRAAVLMYHRIDAARDDSERRYGVVASQFAAQMKLLHRRGYTACEIDTFVSWLRGDAALPAGAFLLTFDDGFLGVYEHARPVLAELGWPAAVFLVSRMIGEHDDWREASPARTYPLLDRHHIAEMARDGFSFQSHSQHHADLTSLPEQQLIGELVGARRDLEDLLGREVPYLSFPYGRFNDCVRSATIEAGYSAAFSVLPGFNRPGQDPFCVRRLDVYGTDTPATLLRKIEFGTNEGSLAAAAKYYVKALRRNLARETHR